MEKPDLSGAYALNGAEDCRHLYADWAETYDHDFAATMAYRLPGEVATAFLKSNPPKGAVLDVGAGTGLLAAALRGMGFDDPIDGVDLSADMLERAGRKGNYRSLIVADITRPLPMKPRYAGIVSSGTFTHGHVGPEGLDALLEVALPGARVVLSVNQAVWDGKGFAASFDAFGAKISKLSLDAVAIYGEAAKTTDPTHADDRALLVSFQIS